MFKEQFNYWEDQEKLHQLKRCPASTRQETTHSCTRPKGCSCSTQQNCTKEVPLLLFWLRWKCSDCTVYKEIYTQCIAWRTAWVWSLNRTILLHFQRLIHRLSQCRMTLAHAFIFGDLRSGNILPAVISQPSSVTTLQVQYRPRVDLLAWAVQHPNRITQNE